MQWAIKVTLLSLSQRTSKANRVHEGLKGLSERGIHGRSGQQIDSVVMTEESQDLHCGSPFRRSDVLEDVILVRHKIHWDLGERDNILVGMAEILSSSELVHFKRLRAAGGIFAESPGDDISHEFDPLSDRLQSIVRFG